MSDYRYFYVRQTKRLMACFRQHSKAYLNSNIYKFNLATWNRKHLTDITNIKLIKIISKVKEWTRVNIDITKKSLVAKFRSKQNMKIYSKY